MLRVVAWAPQLLLLVLVGYTLLTALPGWPTPRRAREGRRSTHLVIAIPAHDEASVIGSVVRDLVASDYPDDGFAVWVIADRCTDATAAVARAAGAEVWERSSGEGGKGEALAAFLGAHPLHDDAALVVFDADNRVPAELLGRVSDEIEAGASVVQAYLDTTRPGESWVTLATALSYWAGNRMVQAARANLGWPVDLGGTGMCFTGEALEAAGGFTGSLVEDQDLSARLSLAGVPVTWIHDVRVRDEKPATAGVVMRQRARWAAGRRAVARAYAPRLVAAGLRDRRWGLVDQAIRLIQPSRTFVAFVTGVLAVVAFFVATDLLVPAAVWAGAAAVQLVAPIPFLVRDRVPWRWVAGYPLLVGLALLWLPIQIVSRRVTGWARTPHRGETGDESAAGQ